jgi:anti-sigma regulatory factor (Ser/Thr protein kinase)
MTIHAADAVATFSPEPATAGLARRFLREQMHGAGVGEPTVETALLLASELVSNAVLHARTEMTVRLKVTAACVRVEVTDGNRRSPVAVAAPIGAIGGWGLQFVQSLADTWGVEATREGKQVWFEVPTKG